MALDFLKTPVSHALPEAIRKQVADTMQRRGKSLPASVTANPVSGIVEVQFELESPYTLPRVTVPVFMSEFVRFPTPVGTSGMVVAADTYLGGISGLGGGTASLTEPANLSALAFVPLGRKAWESVDLTKVVIYGPDGVQIRDAVSGSVVVDITSTGVKMTNGSATVEITGGDIKLDGNVFINGKPYDEHKHTGITAGGAISGPVAP